MHPSRVDANCNTTLKLIHSGRGGYGDEAEESFSTIPSDLSTGMQVLRRDVGRDF